MPSQRYFFLLGIIQNRSLIKLAQVHWHIIFSSNTYCDWQLDDLDPSLIKYWQIRVGLTCKPRLVRYLGINRQKSMAMEVWSWGWINFSGNLWSACKVSFCPFIILHKLIKITFKVLSNVGIWQDFLNVGTVTLRNCMYCIYNVYWLRNKLPLMH